MAAAAPPTVAPAAPSPVVPAAAVAHAEFVLSPACASGSKGTELGEGLEGYQDHVSDRAGRIRRKVKQAWSMPYRAWRWLVDRVLLTLHFAATLGLLVLAISFQYAAPSASLGQNPAFKWLYLGAGTLGGLWPLYVAEYSLYAVLDQLKDSGTLLTELADFASAAKGHLAHIGAVTFALLLDYQIFKLAFDSTGNFYFQRTCIALLAIEIAAVAHALLLKVVLRAVFEVRNRKLVQDSLFHVEVARLLTAPTPRQLRVQAEGATAAASNQAPAAPAAGSGSESRSRANASIAAAPAALANAAATAVSGGRSEGRGGDVMLTTVLPPLLLPPDEAAFAAAQRGGSPTYMLESGSFWTQVAYVRTHNFSLFSQARLCDVAKVESAEDLARAALDRLYAQKVTLHRMALKADIVNAMAAARDESFDAELGYLQRDIMSTESDGALQVPLEGMAAMHPMPRISGAVIQPDTFPLSGFPVHSLARAALPPLAGTALGGYTAIPSAAVIADGPDLVRSARLSLALKGGAIPASMPAARGIDVTLGSSATAAAAPIATALERELYRLPLVEALMAQLVALNGAQQILTLADVRSCFFSDEDASATFSLLDQDQDGSITRAEVVSGFVLLFHHWESSQKALQSYGGISGAISILSNIARCMLLFFVVLAIYNVPINDVVIVPLTTLVVGFSFALSTVITDLIDSLVFTLGILPWDVGDRVQVSSVNSGATIVVYKMHLYTTEFMDLENKHLCVRNCDMISSTIVNLHRSGEALAYVTFVADAGFTQTQLETLRARLVQYALFHPLGWKPGPCVFTAFSDTTPNVVTVTVMATHRTAWQEGKTWGDKNDLALWLVGSLQEMGVQYRLVEQKVRLQPHPQTALSPCPLNSLR